jgi:hypothetical protein
MSENGFVVGVDHMLNVDGIRSAIRHEGAGGTDTRKGCSCALRQHGCFPHYARLSADLYDAGGGAGCSVDASLATDIMTEIRKQNELAMRKRFLQARRSGELSKKIDVDDYTRYLSSILAGCRSRQ